MFICTYELICTRTFHLLIEPAHRTFYPHRTRTYQHSTSYRNPRTFCPSQNPHTSMCYVPTEPAYKNIPPSHRIHKPEHATLSQDLHPRMSHHLRGRAHTKTFYPLTEPTHQNMLSTHRTHTPERATHSQNLHTRTCYALTEPIRLQHSTLS